MAEIKLTRGYSTVVDDEDFEWLNQWKWYADSTVLERVYVKRGATVDGKRVSIYMHRLIIRVKKGRDIDHINGNTLDNRRANLRICSRQNNLRNSKKRKIYRGKQTSSRFKGVTWLKREKKWRANINIGDGKKLCLGYFNDEVDAAHAYDYAATKHHGEFARLNFLSDCECCDVKQPVRSADDMQGRLL